MYEYRYNKEFQCRHKILEIPAMANLVSTKLKNHCETTGKYEDDRSIELEPKPPLNGIITRIIQYLSHPNYAPWIGLSVRLVLAGLLPWLLDGGGCRLLPGVSYTDIDFLVFTDAAEYINRGLSPYDRHTYRYTPFLAAFLSKLPTKECGRYLFCVADALCGYIILHERRSRRTKRQQQQQHNQQPNDENLPPPSSQNINQSWCWSELEDGMWWLYNPLAINICTRGSAESLMVLLPVLLTFWIATSQERLTQQQRQANDKDNTVTYTQIFVCGISHGIAIHSKLYPIIYSLSYMAYFATAREDCTTTKTNTFPWMSPIKIIRLAKLWISRLCFSVKPLLFLGTFLTTFGVLQWFAFYFYGIKSLEEGLLYHFSRVDHRHNYSIFWYWIYLARGRVAADVATEFSAGGLSSLSTVGRLLLVPQAFLLAFSSLGMATNKGQLGLTLFVQTYLFVTHNKVITAQYFTWYLCLLPLCSNSGGSGGNSDTSLLSSSKVIKASIILVMSIILWLGSAYCLEMQGLGFHRIVWLASVFYFFANVNLMGVLLQHFAGSKCGRSNRSSSCCDDINSKKND